MNSVLENVIATIFVTVSSTATALILQAFGFSAQTSISAAGIVLFTLAILFLITRRYYPIYIRWLTKRLVKKALRVGANEADKDKITFKKDIIESVLLENSGAELKQNRSIIEFPNQEKCESHIKDAFRTARKVKILTIRGYRFFPGSRSLLYDLYVQKQQQTRNFIIQVLVLSPESKHITDELAEELGQHSADEIRGKMDNVLKILSSLASQKNFQVKYYNETPNFKILLFDDIMYVSVYTNPKNDQNAKMFQITRGENPLFTGLERHFDDLWKRSNAPQENAL